MDLKEGIIDPIRKFMAGPQKEIYDSARELLVNQKPNLEYGFTESAKKKLLRYFMTRSVSKGTRSSCLRKMWKS